MSADHDVSGETISRAVAGDREAISSVVAAALPAIAQVAARYRLPDADREEVRQDVVVRLLSVLPTYRGEARFSTWVFRLAVNVMLMRARRISVRRREIAGEDGETVVLTTAGDDTPDRALERKAVRRAVEKLTPRMQRALWLYYRDDESLLDIARALGTSEPAIRTMMFHARARLREDLGLTEEYEDRRDR